MTLPLHIEDQAKVEALRRAIADGLASDSVEISFDEFMLLTKEAGTGLSARP